MKAEDHTAPLAHSRGEAPNFAKAGTVLQARQLSRVYGPTARSSSDAAPGSGRLQLFQNLNFEIAAGESVAIVGQSGAGKSSLLHLLAGLDRATAGEVWLGTEQIGNLPPEAAARLRNRQFGFVWQFHYLLPEFTTLENIALPLLARGTARKEALAAAARWLDRVELAGRAHHRAGELSGGEQQRVAIARALVTEPRVLLADEPTGDLDDTTAAHLFELLHRLCRESGLAAVIVTHNLDLAHRCDRVLRLHGGRLEPLPR